MYYDTSDAICPECGAEATHTSLDVDAYGDLYRQFHCCVCGCEGEANTRYCG